MDESRILIVGAAGQLGKALQAKYPEATALDREDLDITDVNQVSGFNWSKFDTVINAAAYTDVDGAESAKGHELAWKINASGVDDLSRAAAKNNLTLVHISTDYVFDGEKTPHKEDEPFSPLSIYGASKAAGDKTVSTVSKHYLLRTSWVIGEGRNFVRTMLEVGKKGVSPTVVADQIGRPTFATEIVRAIDHLLRNRAVFGTYNISNDGEPVSWADLARAIFKIAGFDLEVTDTMTAEYFANKPGVAPRPLNSVLDLTKIVSAGFKPRDWHEDLEDYIKKELNK